MVGSLEPMANLTHICAHYWVIRAKNRQNYHRLRQRVSSLVITWGSEWVEELLDVGLVDLRQSVEVGVDQIQFDGLSQLIDVVLQCLDVSLPVCGQHLRVLQAVGQLDESIGQLELNRQTVGQPLAAVGRDVEQVDGEDRDEHHGKHHVEEHLDQLHGTGQWPRPTKGRCSC